MALWVSPFPRLRRLPCLLGRGLCLAHAATLQNPFQTRLFLRSGPSPLRLSSGRRFSAITGVTTTKQATSAFQASSITPPRLTSPHPCPRAAAAIQPPPPSSLPRHLPVALLDCPSPSRTGSTVPPPRRIRCRSGTCLSSQLGVCFSRWGR